MRAAVVVARALCWWRAVRAGMSVLVPAGEDGPGDAEGHGPCPVDGLLGEEVPQAQRVEGFGADGGGGAVVHAYLSLSLPGYARVTGVYTRSVRDGRQSVKKGERFMTARLHPPARPACSPDPGTSRAGRCSPPG